MHPTFMLDESFTFGLIHHSFCKLINLDAMDVHPPLYYLLLKLFLIITTFWTKSIFIKVIFARIFSLITFIIFLIISMKILSKYMYVKSYSYILIFMLISPLLINGLRVRMYSLSSLFVILTLYYILKFNNDNKLYNLILAILFASCSSYTFYFAGLSSGLLFVIFSIRALIKKHIKSFIHYILSGITLVILFIPWIPIAIKQMLYHSKFDNGTNDNVIIQIIYSFSQTNPGGFGSIIISIAMCIFMLFFIIYSLKHSFNFNKLLILLLIDLFSTLLISIILCGKNFQPGILYPIFSIFMLIMSYVILKILNSHTNCRKIGVLFISVLMIISLAHSYKYFKCYDIPSIYLINNCNKWQKSNSKNITLKTYVYPISKQMTISEDAVYLSGIDKNMVIKHYKYKDLSIGLLNSKNNGRLIKKTFPNIKINN